MSKRPSSTQNDPGYFYNMRRLLRYFAVSSALLMGAVLWMIWADFDRPWKQDQRVEMKWEASRYGVEAFILDSRTQKLRKDVAAARAAAEKAAASRAEESRRIDEELKTAQGLWYGADMAYKTQKQYTTQADFHVHDAVEEAERDAWREELRQNRDYELRLRDMEQMLRQKRDDLLRRKKEIDSAVEAAVDAAYAEGAEDGGRQRRAEVKKLQILEQARKRREHYNPLREVPLLDFLAPPTKVEQVVLDNLVDNYEFSTPKKVDRCGTCHVGSARVGFEPEKWPVEILAMEPGDPEKVRRFEEAVYRFVFSLLESVWAKVPADSKYPYEEGLLRTTEIHHETLRILFAEYDDSDGTIGTDKETGQKKWRRWQRREDGSWAESPKGHSIADYYLAALEKMQGHWRTHSYSDLMVGASSPHPYETFGCTSCHYGRGWSTDFGYAWHTPDLVRVEDWMTEARAAAEGRPLPANRPMSLDQAMKTGAPEGAATSVGYLPDAETAHRWEEELDRTETKLHYWNWPQLPKSLLQAACLKCHREGLSETPAEEYEHLHPGAPSKDLPDTVDYEDHAREFNDDPEAEAAGEYAARIFIPKKPEPYRPETLERGIDNFLSFGCYGCHKIDPVEYPFMQWARPKVGPPLDTIATKTTREWTLKWVRNPKSFRPDTRMPRFWGLSNNSHDFSFRFAGGGKEGRESDLVNGIQWGENEVYAIVEWMYAESEKHPLSFPPVDLSKADPARGERALVGDAGATGGAAKACIACHEVPIRTRELQYDAAALKEWRDPRTKKVYGWGDRMARRQGPDLAGLGSKLKPEWLVAWLKNPRGYWHDTNMPNLRLTDQEALDVAAYLLSFRNEAFDALDGSDPVSYDLGIVRKMAEELKVGEQAETTGEALSVVARWSPREQLLYVGRKLFKHYGCFGCHQIEAYKDAAPIGTELTKWGSKVVERLEFLHAPIEHTRFDFAYAKLVNPRIYDLGMPRADLPYERLKMPRFGLSSEEARGLAVFLIGLVEDPIPAKSIYPLAGRRKTIWEGRQVMRRYNCQGCHLLENRGGDVWPAITSNQKLRPPNLVGQGGKTGPKWLYRFFQGPYELRPFHSIRMPTFGFTDRENEALVAYFSALSRAPYPFETVLPDSLEAPDYPQPKTLQVKDPADPTKKVPLVVRSRLEEARALFTEYQCKSCHSTDPKVNPTDRAPDFLHTRRDGRLRADWIPTWMWDPGKLLPQTSMPSFFAKGSVQDTQFFDGVAAEQIRALTDYLLHHYQETDR